MDHLRAVFAMMGEPSGHNADPAAWGRVEARFDVEIPGDYKAFVDAYAPIQVNGHLYFDHPATPSRDLGDWMEQTIEAFRGVEWEEDLVCPGFESTGPVFGGPSGMTPLASSDRGEHVFVAPGVDGEPWRILACDGEEQDFYEYRMGFSEWLYGYLTGGDMVGEGSSVFYPGPLQLERLPLEAGERVVLWHGPDRGM